MEPGPGVVGDEALIVGKELDREPQSVTAADRPSIQRLYGPRL